MPCNVSIIPPEITSLGGSFIGYLGSSDEFNRRYNIIGYPKHRDGAFRIATASTRDGRSS